LVFYTEGRTQTEDVRQNGAETFGPKSDDETEGRSRLNKQELHNLTPQQIFRVIK